MVATPRQLSIDQCFAHRSPRSEARRRRRAKPGRKRSARARVMHRERAPVAKGRPVQVTLRMRRDVPSLRNRRWLRAFRGTLSRGCGRGSFRVVHYAVQRDHVHLIVEADGKKALSAGMKSVGSRLALAVNRVFRRRGAVLDGRFHSVVLATPRQVRNALRYVLLNDRRHRAKRGERLGPAAGPHPASSGRFFDGWKETRADRGGGEISPPRTWLLTQGWRRHGLISISEVPG